MLKEFLIKRLKETMNSLALPAVLYAENLIGEGFGEKKKQIAVDFILQRLPFGLKPFKVFIRKILSDVIDFVIELGVSKLHSIQKNLPFTI